MKVSFSVSVEEIDGIIQTSFEDAIILYPARIGYQANCNISHCKDGDNVVVEGVLSNIVRFDEYKRKEIDRLKDANKTDPNLYLFFMEMQYSSDFLILEDDAGNQVGIFKDPYSTIDVSIGDKIGYKGRAYRINIDSYPAYYIANGKTYLIQNEDLADGQLTSFDYRRSGSG